MSKKFITFLESIKEVDSKLIGSIIEAYNTINENAHLGNIDKLIELLGKGLLTKYDFVKSIINSVDDPNMATLLDKYISIDTERLIQNISHKLPEQKII